MSVKEQIVSMQQLSPTTWDLAPFPVRWKPALSVPFQQQYGMPASRGPHALWAVELLEPLALWT
jgi:hypothetical protein